MKFMLIGRDDTTGWQGLARGEWEERIARHRQAAQALVAERGLASGKGIVMISAELSAAGAVTTVRMEGGEPRVRQLSLAERAHAPTSIDVVDFGSRSEAFDFAGRAFAHEGHSTETRAVREMWFTYHGSGRGDSPKFVIFFLNDERAEMPPAEIERSVKRHEEVGWQYSAEKGLVRDETFAFAGVRLMPSNEGTLRRIERGRHFTSDGPFTETKELIGGLQIFDCQSQEEVVDWARKLIVREGDAMEVRPVESLWWVYHG